MFLSQIVKGIEEITVKMVIKSLFQTVIILLKQKKFILTECWRWG